MSLVSSLFKIARIANDVCAVASGNPKRIARHAVNKAIGRPAVRRLCMRQGRVQKRASASPVWQHRRPVIPAPPPFLRKWGPRG